MLLRAWLVLGPVFSVYKCIGNVREQKRIKLEGLERLRSEDTLRSLMITHTVESYWIPSQKKTKSKLQI